MNKLSNRLNKISEYIGQGDSVADIGTDHGYLPLYLFEEGISEKLILTDINEGPLEKAKGNLDDKISSFELRLGAGLEPISAGEVDTVVIAGMGGFTIIDILKEDLEKSKSFKKIIIQPRMACIELRKWLEKNEFTVVSESLAREREKLSEILVVDNTCNNNSYEYNKEIDYEISPLLFGKEPLLAEWIEDKIKKEKIVLKNISENSKQDNSDKIDKIKSRIKDLELLYGFTKSN